LRAAGLDGVELSLVLSDDRELHALNRKYAGEDHATDVLSFAQREGAAVAHASTEPLGDVIISVEYAARQAQRALPGELFHLAVHGLVHLLGYDHRDAKEERVMFAYEAGLRRAALALGSPRRVRAPRSVAGERRA
jgi:probable rRNA maturation factor